MIGIRMKNRGLCGCNLGNNSRVEGNRLRVFQDYRFEYDDVGNLIQEKKGKHTTQFTYNTQNQLTHVAKAGQQFEYRYDPFGRRISKKDAFGETTYLWDGDTLISEQRKQLQITYIYEPGSFIPLCQVRDNTIYYYHNDHIGTPQVLTDRQGEVVWQARYQVYGNVVQYEVEAIENPLRFQGQYFDAETGLHYNRHRYYHPVIGRFTSVDPIGLEGGNNSYEYAPNPVSWVDPLGLMAKEGDCGGVAKSAKPSLSAHKKALKEVQQEVGKLPKGKPGKFGSPQAGDSKKGYRLDPPHDGVAKGDPESKFHINWWDYTSGKRGKGGRSDAIPIED